MAFWVFSFDCGLERWRNMLRLFRFRLFRQEPRCKPAKTRRSGLFRPCLEVLEDRLAPVTRIWDGDAVSNNWTNPNNWQGNVAPVAGDDLIFPAGNFDKTTDNNF